MIVSAPKLASAAPATPDLKPDPKLGDAAQRFEAVFVREMLASMRKAKLADDVFGSGATDNFREMADAHTADAIARHRAFGIADLVERQLSTPK